MDVLKNAKKNFINPKSQVHWVKLVVIFLGFVGISFVLSYLLNNFVSNSRQPMFRFAWFTYTIVFFSALIANATIVAPVPFAISLMVAAATHWNPVLVALCGALGGTLGELSGYYAGYLGKKIAISENVPGYQRVEGWLKKYGFWAITFLAIQPVIPFDLGGLIAGLAKMPLHKFLPALFIGKFPKYLLLTYAGIGVIQWIPFLNP